MSMPPLPRHLAPLLLLIIAGIAPAAPALTIQSLPVQGQDQFDQALKAGAITMPWVSGAGAAARQINDLLFMQLFGAPAPKQVGKVLRAEDGLAISALANQEFVIARNDERILSMVFSIEFCGGVDCTDYTEAYSFDSKSGRALSADDLFTPAGKIALARQFDAHVRDRYRNQVAKLKKALKQAKAGDEERREALEAKIALNQECLDTPPRYAAADAAAAHQLDGHVENYYFLGETGVSVHTAACFSHVMRTGDDVGDIELTVPYQKLAHQLTAYGRALLLAQGTATAPDNPYGHLLHGHVGGKTAITMLLDKDADGSVRGSYYYEKYRKPLKLSGDLKDGVLTLKESAGTDATQHPTLTLRAQGGRLVGTWSGQSELTVDVGP